LRVAAAHGRDDSGAPVDPVETASRALSEHAAYGVQEERTGEVLTAHYLAEDGLHRRAGLQGGGQPARSSGQLRTVQGLCTRALCLGEETDPDDQHPGRQHEQDEDGACWRKLRGHWFLRGGRGLPDGPRSVTELPPP